MIITSVPAAQGTRDMGPSHPTSAPKKQSITHLNFAADTDMHLPFKLRLATWSSHSLHQLQSAQKKPSLLTSSSITNTSSQRHPIHRQLSKVLHHLAQSRRSLIDPICLLVLLQKRPVVSHEQSIYITAFGSEIILFWKQA